LEISNEITKKKIENVRPPVVTEDLKEVAIVERYS
jgi:hypothetical protein